jgi:hypothetical protein
MNVTEIKDGKFISIILSSDPLKRENEPTFEKYLTFTAKKLTYEVWLGGQTFRVSVFGSGRRIKRAIKPELLIGVLGKFGSHEAIFSETLRKCKDAGVTSDSTQLRAALGILEHTGHVVIRKNETNRVYYRKIKEWTPLDVYR